MGNKHKRSLRLLAGALAVVSASALAGEITLFQNRDFRGNATTLQSPMLDLERNGFTTASSAVVRSGVWQACTDANFHGQCVQLQPGQYRNINALLNDDVASVREITVASAVPATLENLGNAASRRSPASRISALGSTPKTGLPFSSSMRVQIPVPEAMSATAWPGIKPHRACSSRKACGG